MEIPGHAQNQNFVDPRTALEQRELVNGARRPQQPAVRLGVTAWTYLDQIYPSTSLADTPCAPALTFWNGELCCMWVAKDNTAYFATGTNKKAGWNPRVMISDTATPLHITNGGALAVLGDATQNLHALLISDGSLNHYRWIDYIDDNNKEVKGWLGNSPLNVKANDPPALIGFMDQLFCAFVNPANNEVNISRWTPPNSGDYQNPGSWSSPKETFIYSQGTPGLYVTGVSPTLHMVLARQSDGTLVDFAWDSSHDVWLPGFPFDQQERAKIGCSATSFDDTAFVAFQKNSDSRNVLVCQLKDGRWANNDPLNENARQTPAIAVLDSTVNCIYNANKGNDNSSSLLCSQRPATTYPTDSWMAHLSNDVLWSELSIPGTHDTGADVPIPYAQTQTMSITDQLNAGIRYFDFRLSWTKDPIFGILDMWFYHGSIFLASDLSLAMKNIDAWFNADPSRGKEVLFVEIKNEGKASASDFSDALHSALDSNNRWVTGTVLKTLGELRGKVQLVRRYSDAQYGIDLTDWPDDASPNFTRTVAGQVYTVQDNYSVSSGSGWPGVRDAKWNCIKTCLDLSRQSTVKNQLFLNFASGYGKTPTMTPEFLAIGGSFDGINNTLRDWLRGAFPLNQRLGVVLMDFPEDPEEDLIQAIIQTNQFVI